jgi:hypothetical protein
LERVTDAFFWPTRDPQWAVKLLVIAILLLIPIVGAINGLGWMLASVDRLRAGDEHLAPAGLQHLARGWRVFVVQVVYGLLIALVGSAVYGPAVLLAIHEGRGEPNAGLIVLVVVLDVVAFGIVSLGSLAFNFATPAMVLATDEGGVRAGLNLRGIWRRSRVNLVNTLIAGLMLIAAGFVGSLGLIVCGIGVLFTSAYALAMQAWIIRSFELGRS